MGTRKNLGGEMPPDIMETPTFPRTEQAVPGRAPFNAPRSLSWTAVPVLSPRTSRAAVWGERGAVARPRGVRWRSGEPVIHGAYQNRISFEKNGTTTQACCFLRTTPSQISYIRETDRQYTASTISHYINITSIWYTNISRFFSWYQYS